MILANLDPRLSRWIRLLALAFVAWSVVTADPAPGVSGHALVVSILFAACVLAWFVWLADADMLGPMRADSVVLALAGGGLVGASPSSAASAFVFVAVVSAGLRSDLVRTMQVAACGALGLAISVLVYDEQALGLLAYSLGFAAAALAASNARQFRERADQAEVLLASAQRSREEELRSARLEESARIAREIHDVLAHSLAGLSIQLEATAALLQAGADREEILHRVRRAHELAREGLRETRRAVGALRGDPVSVPDALRALCAGQRSAADRPATLELDVDDGAPGLSGDAGVAVLRVVQEALTNVTKHAAGAEVHVRIRGGDAGLLAEVQDDGGPAAVGAAGLAATGGGYGITGMRERASALGGTLRAGPGGGGWRVELRLPADGGRADVGGGTP